MKRSLVESELYQKGVRFICGLDEAGRGPWAGPVVAAAVILTKNHKISGLKDSKQLTPEKRAQLFLRIERGALYGIGIVSHKEIDSVGIIEATFKAYQKALKALFIDPEYLLIDGRDEFFFGIPAMKIIKGDTNVQCIAAASILAKVTRDRIMDEYDREFPEYGFCEHKGYGVERHQKALEQFGVSEIHRKTYAPIRKFEYTHEVKQSAKQ